ncbi:MAG: hypothetical protein KGO82_03975 [Bacteroidota bacterium]|nr:hypothetical protein [Bacteroidota bacterium]
MELDQLKTSWLSNNRKLENSLRLNEQQIAQAQTTMVASTVRPLLVQRVIECFFHIAAMVLLLVFLLNNLHETPYLLSALALLAFYSTTLLNALKQIELIRNARVSDDLATQQRSLVLVQTHIVNYVKLAVLFIPAFLAFPVIVSKLIKDYNIQSLAGFDIIEKTNGHWWAVEFWAFVVLIPLGIWFYQQVSYRNINRGWVRSFIERSSGKRVTRALEFLKELGEMK